MYMYVYQFSCKIVCAFIVFKTLLTILSRVQLAELLRTLAHYGPRPVVVGFETNDGKSTRHEYEPFY